MLSGPKVGRIRFKLNAILDNYRPNPNSSPDHDDNYGFWVWCFVPWCSPEMKQKGGADKYLQPIRRRKMTATAVAVQSGAPRLPRR